MRIPRGIVLQHALFFCLLIASTQTLAEQAYITDKVVIDIHSLQHEEGLVVSSLSSGTPVEVISTDGDYSHVQTEDNKKGWLNSKYLSFEKPTSLEYLQLLGKYKNLTKNLEIAQAKLGKQQELEKSAKAAEFSRDELNRSKKQVQTLDKQLKSATQELDSAKQKIAKLEKSLKSSTNPGKLADSAASPVTSASTVNSSKPATSTGSSESVSAVPELQVDQGPFKVPFLWSAVAMLFTFIMGIVAGMKWLEHKIRKRHGGVRLY